VPKVALDPDKQNWHPSVLPGQIVLVTTLDGHGQPNVAPKSWVTMAAFGGPIVAFGCTEEHLTLRNVEETSEFVINVPSERLADRIWELVRHRGQERIDTSGLTFSPATEVGPPVVDECSAHLECRLEGITRFGADAFVFGRVVAAAIDADCLDGTPEEQYFRLRPLFFLEGGTYGSIDTAKRAGREVPAAQQLYAVEVGTEGTGAFSDHLAFLRRLRDEGRLLAAGPYAQETDGPSGMYVVSAGSTDEAERLARTDPFVRAGASFTVRRWTRMF
jgi:flavin reductase (DIM6/NTAB) family NADH-FMN oxidoreductase RutF/uncharacterized protein YciI